MTDYLFAYGTLQPGLVPATMSEVAQKLTPIGKGFVRGVLYNLGRYPGAIPDVQSPHQIREPLSNCPKIGTFFASSMPMKGLIRVLRKRASTFANGKRWNWQTVDRWNAGSTATTCR